MSDTFTETTTKSWFSRVASSFVGVLFGFLLVLAMIAGLFWNEGRAVTTARSLAEGGGAVVSVAADAIDPANQGRLVHVSGTVTTDETLTDPDFGVMATGVALVRRAEMYQWKESQKSETRTKLGGGEETVTTYSYARGWDDEWQDSSDFRVPAGHENPEMQWRDRTFALDGAQMGAWRLDGQVLGQMGGAETLGLKPADQATIEAAFGEGATISGGRIYLGANTASPQIGDQRIGYELAPLGPISVIGLQQGEGFSRYQTQAGDALLMVDRGTVPAADMFAAAESANTVITWILRAAGLLLLAMGFALIMGPVGVLLDVLPFLGSIARMGTGLVAFVLAILVGGVVIAFAWFWYRPLLAVGIVVAAFAIAWGIGRLAKARQPAAPVAAA